MSDKKKRQLTDAMHRKPLEDPEARVARKQAEFAEEGDDYHVLHAYKPPEESTLTKLGRAAQQVAGSLSNPWARLMREDEEKE